MTNYPFLIIIVQFSYNNAFCCGFMHCSLDCKSGKCVKVFDPAKDIRSKGFVSWISCVTLDASESWLVRAYLLSFTSILFASILTINL